MQVFVVLCYELYVGSSIEAIYSDRDKAEAAMAELNDGLVYSDISYGVVEYTVQ